MPNLLCRKLEHFAALSEADRRSLDIAVQRVERVDAHKDLIHEGDDPFYVNVILDGWACRYKQLEDGRRQIIALLVPGDMCDPCVFLLREMSHSLSTLTPVTIARISQEEVTRLQERSASINRALWMDLLISAEIQREWTVSLGRRTAAERLAHLFCEMLARLRAVGLTEQGGCDMPVTQADLGDALGLSAVHVNRTLQELRATGLVELRGRRLTVRDERALRSLAHFDVTYLHLKD